MIPENKIKNIDFYKFTLRNFKSSLFKLLRSNKSISISRRCKLRKSKLKKYPFTRGYKGLKSFYMINFKQKLKLYSLQKKLCLIKAMASHLKVSELQKQLTRIDPVLQDCIVSSKRHRRGDTKFTYLAVKKGIKSHAINALKQMNIDVLKEKPVYRQENRIKTINNAKLCSLNINHLYGKKEDLEILLKVEKPTVLCLQETWKKSTGIGRLEKYMVVETPAIGKNKPGLMTLVRKGGAIRCSKKGNDDNILQTVVEIKTSTGWTKILVINVYVPQERELKQLTLVNVINLLNVEKNKRCYKEIIVMGDMNVKDSTLKEKLVAGGLNPLINYNRVSGTRILSNGSVSKRRIDTIFRVLIQDSEKITISRRWSVGDHLLLRRKIILPSPIADDTFTYNRKKMENPLVEERLSNLLNSKIFTIEELPRVLKEVCISTKIYEKVKAPKGMPIRWRHVNVYKRFRHATKRVLIKRSEANVQMYTMLKKKVEETRVKVRRERAKLWAFKGVNLYKSNRSRDFWKWLKGCSNTSVRLDNVCLQDEEGIAHNEQEKKLEIANKFYAKLATPSVVNDNVYNKIPVMEPPDDVTMEELQDATKRCGNNKAAGPDEIPTELYKILLKPSLVDKELPSFLVDEFNKIISGASPPAYWSAADMVCLHKKGDISNLNNYRGIALINTISKIYLKIINDRLTQFVENKNILSPYQAGFRSGEECMNQVATLLEVVKRREFRGLKTFMCFIDFEKAYDNVSHELLFNKLQKYSIPGYLINTLKDIYRNTNMRIRINGDTSSGYSYRKGVRQGCPCSPMLFNLFINDIFDDANKVIVPRSTIMIPGLMFADDIVVFGETKEDLDCKVKQISKWAVDNQMRINCNKCGILVWDTNTSYESENISIDTDFGRICEVTEYRYLGVLIKRNTIEDHLVKDGAFRGKTALEALKPKLLNKGICIPFKAILIKCVLVPALMYGSELWGMSSTRSGRINKILKKAIRMIFWSKRIPLDRILDEFDINRIHIQAALSRFRALRKWKHNKTMIADLVEQVPRERKTTWSSRTRRWCKRYVGHDYESVDYNVGKNKIKEVLKGRRSFNTTLAASIAVQYGIYESQLKFILTKVNNRQIRNYTKIRCNLIRWSPALANARRIPQYYREHCLLCEGEQENLEHFLLDCPVLSEKRSLYENKIPELTSTLPKEDKVKMILGNIQNIKTCPIMRKALLIRVEFLDKMIVLRYIIVQHKIRLHASSD